MVMELSVLDLALAALLILALAGLSLRLGLGIEQRLVVAAARTTIQLLLIGLVLKLLFDNAHFLWVAAMAAVMITAAGRERLAPFVAATGRRVDVVVNYDHFGIAPELLDAYTAVVRGLAADFYGAVTRYGTTGFLKARL